MKKPDNRIPVLSIHFFTWTKDVGKEKVYFRGSAEASDFRDRGGVNLMTRVWNDAADVGFMVAGRTGENRLFVLDHITPADRENPDAEVESWTFVQADTKLEPVCSITIFND